MKNLSQNLAQCVGIAIIGCLSTKEVLIADDATLVVLKGGIVNTTVKMVKVSNGQSTAVTDPDEMKKILDKATLAIVQANSVKIVQNYTIVDKNGSSNISNTLAAISLGDFQRQPRS